jgi:hypothetical protein
LLAGPRGADLEQAVRAAIEAAQAAARKVAPVRMVVERYEERDPHPGGQEAFVVRVQFPWQQQPLVPVMIEVTHDEPVLLPSPRRRVLHGYDEPVEKCAYRNVAITSVADVFEPALVDEVRATWERTLGPFVPHLPDVETVLAETRARLDGLLKL